jgi:hypothetical protein
VATRIFGKGLQKLSAIGGFALATLCFQPAAHAVIVDLTLSGQVNASSTAAKVPVGSFLEMTFTYDTDTALHSSSTTPGGGAVATYTNAITGFATTVTAPDGTTVLYSGTATGGPFGYIRVTDDNTTVAAGTYDVLQAVISDYAPDYSAAGASGSNVLPSTDIPYFDAEGANNGFRSATIRLPLISSALLSTAIPSSIAFSDVNTSNPSTSFLFNLIYTYIGPDGSGQTVNSGPINIGANLTGLSLSAAGTPSEVPLPAALPLFAAGLSGLGAMGWRTRRRNRKV